MKQIFEVHEPVNKINCADDLFKKIKRIKIDYNQENFIVFYLNVRNQVTKSEVLFKGGLDCCVIDPKIIFRKALLNKSSKIIIAHNHPSKCLEPSYEDRDIFKRLKEIGEVISLSVLDSIIFNKTQFYSLETEGK